MRFLVLLGLCFASVGEAKVNVVATVSDLGVIAREVGGEHVNVSILAKATQDPHFVDAKPSLVVMLSRADLLLLAGMDLEIGWLPVLLTGSRNGKIQPGTSGYLDASTLVAPKEVPLAKLDRSMGDVHPGGNPHYTKDPRNALLVAKGIAERLSALDPEHRAAYLSQAKAFSEHLEGRIAQWEKALAPFKGTPVVAYHKSWIYFVDFAGLEEVAFVEPKPGLPPSTGHVAQVLQVIRARKVPLILQEEWYPASTSELLAHNSGAKLVRVPGMAGESQRYSAHLEAVVTAVVQALR
ncbi:MAG: metal ABC transporter substrate-binding protein [Myxococcota bacterium]